MSFRQCSPAALAKGLDETYRAEDWAANFPGRSYYERHIGVIERYEMAVPTFREFLGRGGMRVLESGCGTGRWMAYFENLGNQAFGVDDSWGPLRVAREHDGAQRVVRADALRTPFRPAVFDAAFSSYVAEHFEDGPEALFREIHRVLKPGGLFFVVVPFNNTFRRFVVNPFLRRLYRKWVGRGETLAFAEFRYTKEEVDGFLARTQFEVIRVLPDDFNLPWYRGLFVDLCDVGAFYQYFPKPLFTFGRFVTVVARLIRACGIWHSCEGIFYVARARE